MRLPDLLSLTSRASLLVALLVAAPAQATYAFSSGGAAADTLYRVTVSGGTLAGELDTGYYALGERVAIRTTPERGRHFNGWAVRGPGRIENSAQLQTVYVVGEGEAHLRAVFEDSLYRVEVDRGLGGGTYPANTQIDLRAYVPPGATFTGWRHEGAGELADGGDPESPFTTGFGPSVLTVGVAYDSTALRIRARGACGSEGMTLQIDGRNVVVWPDVPAEPTDFFWGGEVGEEVRVYLNNAGLTDAGCRRELTVEYVDYDGRLHYGREQDLNTGQRVPGGDCSPTSGIRSERIVCRGYILFATMAEEPDQSPEPTSTYLAEPPGTRQTSRISLAPNPVAAGGYVELGLGDAFGPGAEVTVTDLAGNLRDRRVLSPGGRPELRTAGLSPGVYVVRVRDVAGRRVAAARLVIGR